MFKDVNKEEIKVVRIVFFKIEEVVLKKSKMEILKLKI